MATFIGSEHSFRDTLKALIELDFDAVAAYQVAINRLDNHAIQDRLGEFMSDHQRHIQELGRALRDLGEIPPTERDFKAILTQGKVLIGNLTGNKGILQAMHSNEDDTNEAYERASNREDAPAHILNILTQNLADERRHRAWIEERLALM